MHFSLYLFVAQKVQIFCRKIRSGCISIISKFSVAKRMISTPLPIGADLQFKLTVVSHTDDAKAEHVSQFSEH